MTAGAVSSPLIIPIMHLETHRTKNINTNTPVSIQSDTPGVLIFYSLDGSKPTAARGRSADSSRKYSEPILLPAGRVTVRAVAVSSDGRQSSTVTKIFCVDIVDRKQTEENLQFSTEGSSCFPQNSVGSSPSRPEPRMMGNGPRFLTSRLGPPPTAQAGSIQRSPSSSSGERKQLSSSHTSGVQKETNFLWCAQCLSFGASDPFARFCPQCGAVVPPLPEPRLPPAEEGQMILCVFCNTEVPVNTHTCLICEASVQQQLQPQARLTLQDHRVCVCCGSGNPAHISTCLTCESCLQPEVCVGNSAPSVPSKDSRMLTCSRCKRLNHCDARYCDWCGSKSGHAASCVMCWRCGASSHPNAFYCATCGVHLDAPAPPTTCDITRAAAPHQASASASHDATCSPPSVKLAPPSVDQSTQTVGLYYPSATELQRKDQQRELQLSRQSSRDRQPPVTAISPGRGYWRKQVDHVCAHLRSYAQNNAPFRTVLGEPRLGRMVSAVVQEDGYEVSLTISFVSAAQEVKQGDPSGDDAPPAGGVLPAGGTETLSSVTERFSSSLSTNGSDKTAGLVKPPKPTLTLKPPVKDVQLLKELAPGRGHISVIQQLLDQGADPSCCGRDGRHALAVAAVHGHSDVLPLLVQRGADVDQQSGQMKNTALHEAAAQGPEGLKCAEVLLSCRASVRRRNASGQTPYDAAVSSGCNNMASLLAAQTGLDLLDKLRKH
ncbi:double zinc ribbon and ankyrin repeat-containing protein 1 [Paralichthys olivaceus]|uniref:double zinc ribbon and ankyrin repeat-containing protein 1 n=1 Tax=Paralichthys olivaceus TaxID=8255 RepID=UPI0037512FFD